MKYQIVRIEVSALFLLLEVSAVLLFQDGTIRQIKINVKSLSMEDVHLSSKDKILYLKNNAKRNVKRE